MKKTIIIIPTYNERENIGLIIEQLQDVFTKIKDYEMGILIYDSNSPDGTATLVKTYQERFNNIYLQTESKKSGLGNAYINAMNYAIDTLKADIIFEFDADGSHRPDYLPGMMQKFSNGADVVLGSRYVEGGSIQKNWAVHRKLLSVVGNIITQCILSPKIKDYTTGFRGTRTTFLKKIDLSQLKSRNYAYKIHLLWWLYTLEAKIVECPIDFIDRKKGYSKLPKNNTIESLLLVFYLRLQIMERYIKVCCVGGVGVFIQLICFNALRHIIHPVYANMFGIEIAVISNFLLNNQFVFRESRLSRHNKFKTWLKKFSLFNGFSLGSLFLQSVIVLLGLDIFGHGALRENTYICAGIALGSIYNYKMYRYFVWKNNDYTIE